MGGRKAATGWAVIGVAAIAAVVARRGNLVPRRCLVEGPSMIPTLAPGDRLLVSRWSRRHQVGNLVAFTDPRRPGVMMVKRVVSVEVGGLTVAGDNPDASTDSRHFGPVSLDLVVGCARYRYWPEDRRGRL
ncbi:MAG: nickel-type superoxide dismutase maturation protease [Acidimicrobiales bacterium]